MQSFLSVLTLSLFVPLYSLLWTEPTSPLFPGGGKYGQIGVSYNKSIWLIGGGTSLTGSMDVIEYHVDDNNYTMHSQITNNMRATAQSWTNIDDTIYMYCSSCNYIVTYNMNSKSYDNQTILKHNTNINDPCLANINDQYLLHLGGVVNSAYYDGFHIYNMTTNQWVQGPSMPQPRQGHTCQIVNNTLYVIGGSADSGLYDTVITIDVSDISSINGESWSMLNDTLSTARHSLRSIVYEKLIYVIGGAGGGSVHEEVDVIDTLADFMMLDSYLISAVFMPAVAVGYDEKLYVFGGYEAAYLRTMQYALLVTSSPTLSATMPTTSPTIPTSIPSTMPSTSPTLPSAMPTTSPTTPTSTPIVIPSTSPTLLPTASPTIQLTANPWIEPATPLLPGGGKYGQISVSYKTSIWLIGGGTSETGSMDVIEYHVDDNNYTTHSQITNNMIAVAQSWINIDDTIYMYCSSCNYIVTYNITAVPNTEILDKKYWIRVKKTISTNIGAMQI